jgi:dTDP-glucose 4,6-dehydratase
VHQHHVSTDEVYGSLGPTGLFTEETPYDPRSPYSASKPPRITSCALTAHTFGVSITLSNCSNNYAPPVPEKLVPLMILNMLERKPAARSTATAATFATGCMWTITRRRSGPS